MEYVELAINFMIAVFFAAGLFYSFIAVRNVAVAIGALMITKRIDIEGTELYLAGIAWLLFYFFNESKELMLTVTI